MSITYEYAVIPGPGMYGDGRIRAVSRHHSAAAAIGAARTWTRNLRRDMRPHGGTSGRYLAVEWGSNDRHFWADAPPESIE